MLLLISILLLCVVGLRVCTLSSADAARRPVLSEAIRQPRLAPRERTLPLHLADGVASVAWVARPPTLGPTPIPTQR
ncbi:MAG: hypothetical protein AAF916_01320 [Planctomycetota bacterium]